MFRSVRLRKMSIFQGGSCKRDEECLIYKDVNLHRQEMSFFEKCPFQLRI